MFWPKSCAFAGGIGVPGSELRKEARSLEESREWLAGSGEMAERIRVFDWSRTPLGTSEGWSPALRTTVGLMIANRFPMLLWWGPDYISLYNEAYIPVLGSKYPRALGLPVRECWSEIWDILKPLIDTPFNGGPSTWIEDFELYIQRSGFTEETHFTVAYSPVPDATTPSGIGGVLATVHEISEKVIAQRRNITLPLGEHQPMKLSAAEFVNATARGVATSVGKDMPRLAGKRVLVVEDEPLVALDIVAALEGAGVDVVGSAGTAKEALHIIDNTLLDAALLDANLRGHPVGEIAAALAARNVPFLFVTGYGRENLPRAFAKTAVLSKPFSQEQLIAAATLLVEAPATVHRLRKQ